MKGWDIFKGDSSGRLNSSSITFNPEALNDDSAWGNYVILLPFSILNQPDYQIKFYIESVKGAQKYTHTEYSIGVNEGYTSISITNYDVDSNNELYNGQNILSHTLSDFKPICFDLGAYWYDDPSYNPELRIDGINSSGAVTSYHNEYFSAPKIEVSMDTTIYFSIDITNVAENDTLLVSYSPFDQYVNGTTPTTYVEKLLAFNAQYQSFLYKFSVSSSGTVDALLQSKYEEGFTDGQTSAEGYYSDYYQGIIKSEKDKAYNDGYNKGYTSGKADGNSGDYNEGYNDGLDDGFVLGRNHAESVTKSFDLLGKYAVQSLTIFASHGNIFGYSLLDLIVGLLGVAVALWLAKKVL